MKKLILSILLVITAVVLASCGAKTTDVQGVTDTEIKVGNAASTTGKFAGVGIPFNQAIQAVFKEYNEGGLKGGLVNNRKIKFITYDDTGLADVGKTQTEKLVEEDKVFSLVGHFGTWTVGATVDYIREIGIPMVHAATGTNKLYFENTPGNPVMAIQPIYKTDGRVMTARAFTWPTFGSSQNEKLKDDAVVGVVYSDDDAGKSIVEGVDVQLELLKKSGKKFTVIREAIKEGTYDTVAEKVKNADVLIVAANQAPFKAFITSVNSKNIKAPIFTSYVNAAVENIKQQESNVGPIFADGWTDNKKAEDDEFARIIRKHNSTLSADELNILVDSPHAMSGYVAATTFIEGLRRVGTEKLTWESFIKAMESAPIDLLRAGAVDFRNGQRIGTDTMSLWTYDRSNNKMVSVDGLKSIPEILK